MGRPKKDTTSETATAPKTKRKYTRRSPRLILDRMGPSGAPIRENVYECLEFIEEFAQFGKKALARDKVSSIKTYLDEINEWVDAIRADLRATTAANET